MYAVTHIHAITPAPGVTLRLWQTPTRIVSLAIREDPWQVVVVNRERVKLDPFSPLGSAAVSVTPAVLSWAGSEGYGRSS